MTFWSRKVKVELTSIWLVWWAIHSQNIAKFFNKPYLKFDAFLEEVNIDYLYRERIFIIHTPPCLVLDGWSDRTRV